MTNPSDEEILHRLQFGEASEVDQALSHLHRKVYLMSVRFVKRYRGTQADAEDVFQDGLVALYKLARQGKLAHDVNVEAYLFTICKNLWFKQLKKRKETVELDNVVHNMPVESVQLSTLFSEERRAFIQQLFSHIGEGCRKILTYYYYDRMRMKKIAEVMEYANEQVAKNKKSKCMKLLKELLDANPGLKENLRNT